MTGLIYTSTEELEKLASVKANCINVVGDYVYYSNYDDFGKLYKTNIKDKTTQIIYPYEVSSLFVTPSIFTLYRAALPFPPEQ